MDSDEAKIRRHILSIWDQDGLELAMTVSGKSRATLFRWRDEAKPKRLEFTNRPSVEKFGEFRIPTTFDELEALPRAYLKQVPDEVIIKLMEEAGVTEEMIIERQDRWAAQAQK